MPRYRHRAHRHARAGAPVCLAAYSDDENRLICFFCIGSSVQLRQNRVPENPKDAISPAQSKRAACRTGIVWGSTRLAKAEPEIELAIESRIRFPLPFPYYKPCPRIRSSRVAWKARNRNFVQPDKDNTTSQPAQNHGSRANSAGAPKPRGVTFAALPFGNHTRPKMWLLTGHWGTF